MHAHTIIFGVALAALGLPFVSEAGRSAEPVRSPPVQSAPIPTVPPPTSPASPGVAPQTDVTPAPVPAVPPPTSGRLTDAPVPTIPPERIAPPSDMQAGPRNATPFSSTPPTSPSDGTQVAPASR